MTNNLKRAINTDLSCLCVHERRRAEILENALEGKKVKKKLSAGIVLAFVLVLLSVSALAVAGRRGVMDFLFAEPVETAKPFVRTVSRQVENELIRMEIDSALCDGQSLAFDWTITLLAPDRYCRLSVESFTANGERLWLDGTDDFDNQWFPNVWTEDNTFQDGDIVLLPDALKNADTLDVEMVVGVYEPTKPVFVLPEDESGRLGFSSELALDKIRQGFVVIDGTDGWVIEDEESEDGVSSVVGFIPKEGDPFTRTELRVNFTVDVASCAAATIYLKTQPRYEEEKFTAVYDRAMLTPMGLYLDMTWTPREGISAEEAFADIDFGDGQFELTDARGNVIDLVYPSGGGGVEGNDMRYGYTWFGLTREQLPPQLSLSYRSGDGKTDYIFAASLE